jgi:hypothetical protein
MKAKIFAYRQIRQAEIDINLIALVQGPNESGKSSIAGAIRAAMTGDPAPDVRAHEWIKYRKDDLRSLVHDGSGTTASVLVETEDGSAARMVWPDCKFSTSGARAPFCSPTAAGVWKAALAAAAPRDRGPALVDMLSGLVAEEDFQRELRDRAPDAVIAAVWQKVQEAGWDVAQKHGEEKLRAFKADWKAVAKTEWGVAKAQGWRPDGWEPEMEHLTAEAAQASVEAAAAALQALGVDSAVAQHQMATLKDLADQIPAHQKKLLDLDVLKKKAEAELAADLTEREKMPAANAGHSCVCPACKADLYVLTDHVTYAVAKIEVADKNVSPKQLAERRSRSAQLAGNITRLQANIRAIENQVLLAEQDLKASQAAAERLSKVEDVDPVKMAEAQKLLERARLNLELRQRVDAAAKKQATIEVSLAVVAALDPKGVRRTVMLRKLSDFNSRLADISTQMAIGLVQIDGSTFEIKVGERLYRDMSDSAQFRARIAMQVATAEIDGSCMVIIDNDVDFDTRWYQKLLGMLLTRGMRAVVSLRVDAIGKAMNTAKATNPVVREKIASYWLQDGTATKLEKGEE